MLKYLYKIITLTAKIRQSDNAAFTNYKTDLFLVLPSFFMRFVHA